MCLCSFPPELDLILQDLSQSLLHFLSQLVLALHSALDFVFYSTHFFCRSFDHYTFKPSDDYRCFKQLPKLPVSLVQPSVFHVPCSH